jgi:hypothetical protein
MTRADEFLTVDEAAHALKISSQRVRVLLAKGHLQGCLLPVGDREIWHVHASLTRRPAKAGRPKKRRAAGEAGQTQ